MVANTIMETALEAVLVDLKKAVASQIKITAKFKTLLKRLDNTLRNIEPIFYERGRLSKVLDRPQNEIEIFIYYVDNEKEVVLECSSIKCWNVYRKFGHANRLVRLDNELFRFFQVELQDRMGTSIRSLITIEINALGDKMDQILSAVTERAGGFFGSCSVPGIPDVIVGLDFHLEELKRRLLKDDNQVLTVSAPGGCGKTTLAKMLCHDNDIKGVFGENIFYVTVSRMASLMTIVQKLFAHHLHVKHNVFQNDEDAKNQLEYMMRQMGSQNILLVLDDVWSESESIVHDLKFPIPGYKILVTSRFFFPRFGSTYELSLLNDEDAKTLFCYSAFPCGGNPITIPDDLVNEMVKYCKGFPLALTVIGASLCGQGVLKWKTTLKRWSEGQSIFQSNSRLLHSLKASVDALEGLSIARNCFLDLGSFPEDERIAAPALMDLWVELYGLDEEGMYTCEFLLELSSRYLLSFMPTRKDASELEGYCNEHYVTQHDLLRELSIHLSSQEPIPQRERLMIEIHGNGIPSWWIEQTQQPISARLMSITTDEYFPSIWYDLQAPMVEALILNIRSQKYVLPYFVQKMYQLKVLNITSYGTCPSEIHELPFIHFPSNLRRMRLEHLSISPAIHSIYELKNLRKLSFIMCEIGNALNSCTIDASPLPNLAELEIDRCYDLKELPAGLCNLDHLEKLTITNCHELDALPNGLGCLSSLEILRLHSCTKLAELPKSIGNLRYLVFLDISDCLSITSLPDQIGELTALRVLKMSGCRGLQELPDSVTDLSLLEDVICDEETSYLWSYYKNDLYDLKINVVEGDPFADFMKIVG